MQLKCSFLFAVLMLGLMGCGHKGIDEPLPAKTNPNLAYFGYALVDVGWDDPTDTETKTNYVDEIQAFSNVADILVTQPTDNIVARMQVMEHAGMKAILHLNEIFFEQKSTGGSRSGVIYGLRADYQARWDSFVATNALSVNHGLVSCFYIGEEPAWNGIPENEFTQACDYAQASVPAVPILSVEAYPAVDYAYAPASVDWLGFDHYFLSEPSSDTDFLREYNTIKSKMSGAQKMFLIMDAHYIKDYHGALGVKEKKMDLVARDYYNLANADTMVVGILGYFWPNGFDIETSVGARNLPEHVREEHKRIGRAITGK